MTHSNVSQAGVGVLIGGGAMKSTKTGEMVFHLGILDFEVQGEGQDKEARSIDLGFLAHGVTPSPHDARLLVLFEKHGPGCCVVDLESGEVVRTIEAGKGRQFYGHGVFSADASLLYCTETDVGDKFKGYIAVRDAHDFTLLGDFPSFGQAPHDCMLFDDGRTLVIANGGSRVGEPDGPNVAYVDIQKQSLLERAEIPDTNINAGHLAMTSRGDLAVVSAPRGGLDPNSSRGGVSLRPHKAGFRTVRDPRDITDAMLGETLSVAIHEPTRLVGATTPLGHLVTFWDLDSGRLVKKLRVPNPRGIALSLDADEFIINFGQPPRAARVDARTLEPVDAPGNRRGYLSLVTGSHILMYPPLAG